MQVAKRNNQKASVRFDEITDRLENLLYGGLNKYIDPALITQKVVLRVYDGIKTREIDELSAQVCAAMVTIHSSFGILAGRIVVDNHHKNTPSSFLSVVESLYNNVGFHGNHAPLVSKEVLQLTRKYKKRIQETLNYSRDFDLGYFGFKTLEKAYLKKINGEVIERPQHMFMRVSLGIHGDNFEEVVETYNYMSNRFYTHATPTLFHAGTPRPQMSSCFLLDGSEDSVEGIFSSITNCALISKWAGGIGVHISSIRGTGSYIRKTGGKSDGILPMLRTYNSTARYINQSGKRPGSFAMYIEPWHLDIFAFLDAKKNHGSEEERARDLFYALWIPDIFMQRVKDDGNWTLMCPDEYPGLADVYGEKFEKLYIKYEAMDAKHRERSKRHIKARDVWRAIISSQVETGTPYMLYKNACNSKSNQQNLGTIKSSNLCAEIVEYSNANQGYKDNKEAAPEAAVCNLASLCLPMILEKPDISALQANLTKIYTKDNCAWCKLAKATMKQNAINFTEISLNDSHTRNCFYEDYNVSTLPQIFVDNKIIGGYSDLWERVKPSLNWKKLAEMTASVTRNLNKIIDKNFYPIEAARYSNLKHRPIGIGVQGLADLFISLRLPFTSDEAKRINKKVFETMYFGALFASWELAACLGAYETFKGSPLSQGKFQFDLWPGETSLSKPLRPGGLWDWEYLRQKIVKDGVRNSLLIAVMPTASTSQIMGNNECIEPYTSNIFLRRTIAGEFTMINTHLMNDLIALDMWNGEIRERLLFHHGSVQKIPEIPKLLRDIYKTVWEISQKECIVMSSDRGRFVCQSQSFNLWFDKPTFNIITNAHMYAWKMGLKTGSYYIRSKAAKNSQRFTMDPKAEKKLEAECLECSS